MPIDPQLAWEMTQTAIHLAPKIAEGAKKLWSKTQRKSESVKAPLGSAADKDASSNPAKSNVASEVSSDADIHDLQIEMLAATDLIKALAAQNAQFAKYIESSRFQFEANEKQSSLLAKRVESDGELLKVLESQNARLAKDVEDTRLQFGAIEKQNGLLAKRVEADSALIKGLESYNLRLVKDVEIERARVNRLNSICIAIGVVAVAGLAMAVRLSLQ